MTRRKSFILLTTLLISLVLALGASKFSLRYIGLKPYSTLPPQFSTVQSMPSYVVVFPKPGSTTRLTEEAGLRVISPDDPSDTTFNIPVVWSQGKVCVTLSPIVYYEETGVYPEQYSLTLNGKQLIQDPSVSSDLLGYSMSKTLPSGDTIIESVDGGPWGICWYGLWEAGFYVAELQIEKSSYVWWYKLEL